MPTYVYETIPSKKGEQARRFELRQSMKEEALSRHPETGERIRRLVTGGLGLLASTKGASPAAAPAPRGGCCSGACGCHH